MLRFVVAFCSVTIGLVIGAIDLIMMRQHLPPRPPGAPNVKTFEEDMLTYQMCITMYGVTYTVGRLLYRWWGAHDEADQLEQWSRWHMVLLNGLGCAFLVSFGWQAGWQVGVLRPAFVTGIILGGVCVYDLYVGIQELRRPKVPRTHRLQPPPSRRFDPRYQMPRDS